MDVRRPGGVTPFEYEKVPAWIARRVSRSRWSRAAIAPILQGRWEYIQVIGDEDTHHLTYEGGRLWGL
jgi:hypothetical protein